MPTKPELGARLNRNHARSRGLRGRWLFNDRTGSRAHNIVGDRDYGTLTDMDPATDWVGSEFGGALDFDGSNDVVIVSDPKALDLSQGTIVARIKADTNSPASTEVSSSHSRGFASPERTVNPAG